MMGLFDWFKGRADGPATATQATLPQYPPALPDDEIDAVFARASEELDDKTAAHIGSWHMDGARWDADLEAGTITFVNQRGWTIRAPVQVIGTRAITDSTWLWAWDNPSIPAACAADARLVKAFGEAQGLEALTTRKIEASEENAWELTALAAHLAGATGAYRGPSGPTEVFMTFGAITIEQA
jgi:hypothetical protein